MFTTLPDAGQRTPWAAGGLGGLLDEDVELVVDESTWLVGPAERSTVDELETLWGLEFEPLVVGPAYSGWGFGEVWAVAIGDVELVPAAEVEILVTEQVDGIGVGPVESATMDDVVADLGVEGASRTDDDGAWA